MFPQGRAINSHSDEALMSKFVFFFLFFLWQNNDVTEAIQKVAAAYDCKIVEGVLSHQLKQKLIDGTKVVLSVSNPETRVDDVEFEENEVYAIDIVASTGDGKVIAFVHLILMAIVEAFFYFLTIFRICSQSY